MMLRVIRTAWYLLVALLPLQTTLIFLERKLGQLPGIWQYGIISVYATDILLLAIVVLGGYFVFKEHKLDEIVSQKNRYLPLFIFLIIACASVLWSDDWLVSLQASIRLTLAAFVFCIACVTSFSKRATAYAWWGGSIIQGVLAWWQFYSQEVVASKWLGVASHLPSVLGDVVVENDMGRLLRAYGTFPHPNILALFLAVGLVCGAILFLTSQRRWERITLVLGEGVVLIGLMVSFGRAAWIAFIVVFMVAIIYSLQKNIRSLLGQKVKWFGFLVGTMAIVVIASGMALMPFIGSRVGIGGWQRLESKSINERSSSLEQAIESIVARPLLGTGVGVSTMSLFNADRGALRSTYVYQPVHVHYVLILVELGIVGLLFFAWWMIAVLRNLFSQILSPISADQYLWSVGGLMIIGLLLITGLFDHFLWSIHAGVLLWWIGWSVAVIYSER